MKKITVLTVLTFSVLPVFAAQNLANVTVTTVDTRITGETAVFFSGTVPNEGCTLTTRAIIEPGNTGTDDMVAAALTTKTSGETVGIRVDGCTGIGDGVNTAPKIVRFSVY